MMKRLILMCLMIIVMAIVAAPAFAVDEQPAVDEYTEEEPIYVKGIGWVQVVDTPEARAELLNTLQTNHLLWLAADDSLNTSLVHIRHTIDMQQVIIFVRSRQPQPEIPHGQ